MIKFIKSNKSWIDIPKWSASPFLYLSIAEWVSYISMAENMPIPQQAYTVDNVDANIPTPRNFAANKPAKFRPIRPLSPPIKTEPYPSMKPRGRKRPSKEAPPNMAALTPIVSGRMF